MKRKTQGYIVLVVAMILLFFALSVGWNLVQNLRSTLAISLSSMRFILIFEFFIYFVAGMIFGIEKFLSERKHNGNWRINLPKLLILGIPSLLIGSYYILYYVIPFPFVPTFVNLILIDFNLFVNFMQMLFGYIIITSFYKSEEIPSANKPL